jgi:hypothetical protein
VKPMPEASLSWRHLVCLVVLSSLAVGLSLGSSTRLTYHEAFVAQGARELLASGHWWYPTIGGLPWLEKPPLPFWLAASLGWCAGGVTPTVARLPSAVAAMILVLGVGLLTARRYGSGIAILAGAIQATTVWTVIRGRLAEADILLACLIVWTLLAFDRMRVAVVPGREASRTRSGLVSWRFWRWAFFGLLGVTTLVKGTGFGAALALSVVATVLLWDRDRVTRGRLLFPAGWIMVAVLVLAWPLAMIVEHGFKVVGLWAMHITARIGGQTGHGPFAGESWREYGLNILAQALPWMPLAVVGAWWSLGRALRGRRPRHNGRTSDEPILDPVAGDRLLWCWAIAPLVLVSLASARNAHYAIYALVPWSVWSALGLARLGSWQVARGWSPARLKRLTCGMFAGLAAAYGVSFWLAGPWFDRRGAEWTFYETVGRTLPPAESLVLLYNDWDRDPYPTPFGPIPHDLAVRLYYLNRPVCWHFDAQALADHGIGKCPQRSLRDAPASMVVIGRDRDLPALEELGQVEVLSRSSAARWDRTYLLARVQPGADTAPDAAMQSSLVSPIRQ